MYCLISKIYVYSAIYRLIDNVLVCSGVCFNHSRGLFQPSDATIKSNKHWSSLSVCSDHKTSFYFVLISHNEVKRLSLSFLHWGFTQLTNKRAKKVACFYSTNLQTYILYILFASFSTIKYYLLPVSKICMPPDLFLSLKRLAES